MAADTITLSNGQTFKLGLISPIVAFDYGALRVKQYANGRQKVSLRFGGYQDPALASVPPPTSTNWRAKAAESIKRVYKNDQYGCCVISSAYHATGLWTGNDAGAVALGTDQEVVSMYHTICGSGDNGCNIPDVLDYRKERGLPFNGVVHKIDDYVSVDWTNKTLVQTAIALFGSMTLGIDLPASWSGGNDGSRWDVTNSRSVGGHDVACFTGDTKVSLLDGTERTFKELAEGAAGPSFWVYSCDSGGNVVPGLARSARMTRRDAELVKVTLDNGETIRCTADHRFMLRDGTYRQADSLCSGDSLMPLYRKIAAKPMKGYEKIYNPATRSYKYTHRTVAAAMHGGRYDAEVVHHKDFNKRNNSPNNLELMSWADHTRLHAENVVALNRYARSEEGRAKSSEVIARLWSDPAWRKKMVDQLGKNGRAACLKKAAEGRNGFQSWSEAQWTAARAKASKANRGRPKSEAHRRATSAGLRKLYATDPEAYGRLMERQAKAATGASRQQRAGITDAQREVRRENIKKAHAARMARLAVPNNHKVVSVEPAGREDVYDLTVEDHHNFALSAGVFVHNCIDYDQDGVWISTWGGTRLITWAAFTSRKYLTEAELPLSPDWYGKDNLAPNGVAVSRLRSDLAQLGSGTVPNIDPPPLLDWGSIFP